MARRRRVVPRQARQLLFEVLEAEVDAEPALVLAKELAYLVDLRRGCRFDDLDRRPRSSNARQPTPHVRPVGRIRRPESRLKRGLFVEPDEGLSQEPEKQAQQGDRRRSQEQGCALEDGDRAMQPKPR
jgi:hypothetical protein